MFILFLKIQWIHLIILANNIIVCCLPDKQKKILTKYKNAQNKCLLNAIKRNTCKTGGSLSWMKIPLIPF